MRTVVMDAVRIRGIFMLSSYVMQFKK